MLRPALALFILALTTGCAPGQGGAFGPEVLVGNTNFVTVSDPIGLPGGRLTAAENYCAKHAKTAVFQAQGGDDFRCARNNWCATYLCK